MLRHDEINLEFRKKLSHCYLASHASDTITAENSCVQRINMALQTSM